MIDANGGVSQFNHKTLPQKKQLSDGNCQTELLKIINDL